MKNTQSKLSFADISAGDKVKIVAECVDFNFIQLQEEIERMKNQSIDSSNEIRELQMQIVQYEKLKDKLQKFHLGWLVDVKDAQL